MERRSDLHGSGDKDLPACWRVASFSPWFCMFDRKW